MTLAYADEYVAETLHHATLTIEIRYDTDPVNPRQEFGDLATLALFHRRYDLGDTGHGYDPNDYQSWQEFRAAIEADGGCAITPVYLYDHSGLALNTTGFSCPWDSGQVGWAYATPEALAATGGTLETAATVIEAEVEEYGLYLSGQTYGYTITDHRGLEVADCWGFYGIEHARATALEEAKAIAKGGE